MMRFLGRRDVFPYLSPEMTDPERTAVADAVFEAGKWRNGALLISEDEFEAVQNRVLTALGWDRR